MCRDLILNKNNAQTYKEHYGQQYKSLGNKWRNLTNLITGKQFTVKPPVSNLATKISSLCGYKTGSLMRPYWVCLIGSEVCPMFKCPIYVNSQFQEKNLKLHWEISVSCTFQECDVTTPYPIFTLLSVKWLLTGV